MTTETTKLTRRDFKSDQEVRWCPGCGDYAILAAVQTVFPELGIPKENFAVVSGIGCSSRFPYYMDTYGFHTIHGRAPAVATGLKMARPDLSVWVITGDGDALSIGGNHFIHAIRRNVGLKILLFNNRIYGLTKGQYSPTSEVGKRTKSSPVGSVDAPFNPLSVALGAGATFVARTVDVFQPHMKATLKRAAEHDGTAFVEIYQNCNIFNDKAYQYVTEKEARLEDVVYIENDAPLLFGKEKNKGLRLKDGEFEVVEVGSNGVTAEDCLKWDEARNSPALAFQLAQLDGGGMPTALGVFRCVDRPNYEQGVLDQIRTEEERQPDASIEKMLHAGDTWEVS
ncbi:MAG: 2-oxoacid:ferredoxin oxidoreductase subunit beta [Acidobacteriota bacterium]